MHNKKHYHFIGIGGAGMGPLASLILGRGHQVSGSDLKENAVTARLKREGASIFLGHESENITQPDFVVYSSAISAQNPEIVAAHKKNITILKRAQVLAELANAQTAITVAGAHGKTTTSAMISCLLLKSGLQPTTFVGGIVNGADYNAHLGQGKYFVAEVDESDGSFLYFRPYYSVITNIDFEHLDYYHNWENILKAYQQFISQTHPEGLVLAWGEDQRLKDLLKKSSVRRLSYGFNRTFEACADNIVMHEFSSSYDFYFRGQKIGRIDLKIPGQHNILNSLAAAALGWTLHLDFDAIYNSLGEYYGVQRRFQLKAEAGGVMVIDDYGHHPTEMAATLRTAKSFPGKRVVTVFQPHRYSRTQWLMDELAQSLAASDYLIVTDIYAASEQPIEGVTSQALLERVRRLTQKPTVYLKKEDIAKHLLEIALPDDLILTLGAGDVYRVGEEFVRMWQEKHSSVGIKKELV